MITFVTSRHLWLVNTIRTELGNYGNDYLCFQHRVIRLIAIKLDPSDKFCVKTSNIDRLLVTEDIMIKKTIISHNKINKQKHRQLSTAFSYFYMGNQMAGWYDYDKIKLTWAPSQYPKSRLSARTRKVSKPRDLYLELSDRSEIWQALRQRCCRCSCQISKRYDNIKYQSRGCETLRDLTKRRLLGYSDGALMISN